MADLATITINDGEDTPVAHVFEPMSCSNGNAGYNNLADQTWSAGQERIDLSSNPRRKIRPVKTVMRIPKVVTEVVNSVNVNKVLNFGTVTTTYNIPDDWEEQDKENLRVLNVNLQQSTVVTDLVEEGGVVHG